MVFYVYFIFLWALDYIYFKLKYSRPDGPPVYYFFPFLGLQPFYMLPDSLFKHVFRYYLRNFPDVLIGRFLWKPIVLIKNSAVQDAQSCPNIMSRPSLTPVLGHLITGKPHWYMMDNNDPNCPWYSIRKTNIAALNVLPRVQKFRRVAEVADHFMKTIEDHGSEVWDCKESFALAKYQEASNINLGITFESDVMQSVNQSMSAIVARLHIFVPIFLLVPYRLFLKLDSLGLFPCNMSLFRRVYAKVARRLVEDQSEDSEEPRHFIEAVLRVKDREDAVEFLKETLMFNMVALTHTTLHSTLATLGHISLDSRVQKKLREELDEVVGSSNLDVDHLEKLHYLKAVIQESFRMSSPIPTALRLTSGTAHVGGYNIMSGMISLLSLESECVDPQELSQPDAFIPERHLNSDGEFEKSKTFDVFSRGKRRCSGIETANLSVQVYCAKILQNFELLPGRSDIGVARYTKHIITSTPSIPMRFVRREGAPAIVPNDLQYGLAAFIEKIMEEEKESL